jgi:predicted NAD/FAD-dependent oxidoreductase
VTAALQPVIVGAGPAGVRAAEALVDAGCAPS